MGAPPDDTIAGLLECVDEAIDHLEMYRQFLPHSDVDSRVLAINYLEWALEDLRDAGRWATSRFANRNAKHS